MTEKRFTYLNTNGWNKEGFLNVMNGLNEKNKKLQKENEQLKSELKALRKKYNDFSDMVEQRLKQMDMRLVE